jgi:hypothetical protein
MNLTDFITFPLNLILLLLSSLASGSCLSCLGASSIESLLRWHEDLLAEPSGERRDRSLSSEEDYVIDDALP